MGKVWEQKRKEINALLKDLQQKPDREKRAYPLVAGGILNAYREGDVSFDDAVSQLCEWAIGYATQHSVQRTCLKSPDGNHHFEPGESQIICAYCGASR